MILYDSNAGKTGMVGKYEGSRTDKDRTIFESFEKAKRTALKNANQDLLELKERIAELEAMTEESCPYITNPFTGCPPQHYLEPHIFKELLNEGRSIEENNHNAGTVRGRSSVA